MKFVKFCLFSLFVLSLCSCPDRVGYPHRYTKAFFLGEDQIIIDGTVFDNFTHQTENEKSYEFDKIYAKALDVDGWEIDGINKGNGKFEFLMTSTANGVTLLNEKIKNDYSKYIEIEFYCIEGDRCYLYNKGISGYYHYAYVSEAMDLSETYSEEVTNLLFGGKDIITYHIDLNFSKPGWYKIIDDQYPIKDAPKHSSGKNTSMMVTR
jgi:hypothetical protein